MNWVQVLSQDELPEGTRRVVAVEGHDILLIHHEGQVYAVDNTCPHMGASLEKGEVKADGTIVCPRHRSVFDLRSGSVKEWAPWPPGVGRVLGTVSREKPLPVYPTRVEEGGVWVGLEQ